MSPVLILFYIGVGIGALIGTGAATKVGPAIGHGAARVARPLGHGAKVAAHTIRHPRLRHFDPETNTWTREPAK